MKKISSFNDLQQVISKEEKSYLLLYKKGSSISDCALNKVKSAAQDVNNIVVGYADVSSVKDIHSHYNITSAPVLLEFEKDKLKNTVKGCNTADYYKTLFEDAAYYTHARNHNTPQKSVTVYSTPACTWCNTLKNYLKKHRVRFTDIDVSRDQRAAEEMVRRSGQMGVPQTDIDGEMIVGFNQGRINILLGLKNN